METPTTRKDGEVINEIIVAPSSDPIGKVEALCDMYTDVGFAADTPGAKRGGPSGFGMSVRAGQWVPITHPFVRSNPSNFRHIPRPVTLEDLPPLDAT
jgi:hypothetical protein